MIKPIDSLCMIKKNIDFEKREILHMLNKAQFNIGNICLSIINDVKDIKEVERFEKIKIYGIVNDLLRLASKMLSEV